MIHLNISLFTLFLLFFNLGISQNKERSRLEQDIENSGFYIPENETNDTKVALLGQHIQNAIIESNSCDFMTLFDTKGFGSLVTKSTINNHKIKAYREGFLKGFISNINAFPKKIIAEVEAGSYYDFVNYSYSSESSTYHMLFRIYSADTGINYHQYRVSQCNGKFTFNDIYVYLTGEELSKTLQRFYLYNMPKKSLLDFFGKNNIHEFLKLVDGVNFYNQGEFKKAYHNMDMLKGDLKNDKFVLVVKAVCASNLSDDIYKKSIKNIISAYPDDATLYLSQIDYYLLNEDYHMALSLLEKLKEDTSDDFLELLMGNVEFQRMDYEKALKHFKTITKEYPDLFDGHSSMLTCLSLLKKFDECIKVLTTLVENGYAKTDVIGFVEETDDYNENILKDLAASEAFKKWKDI